MTTLFELDQVPWSQLKHAFGPATDVPDLIRSLVSPDASERNAAYGKLFTNIWHQGSVYEATPYALPFLVDLLRMRLAPEQESLVALIACIIAGRGYWEVHSGIELKNPFSRKPIPNPPDLLEKLASEQRIVAEIRKQGRDLLSLLLPYLQHQEGDLRSHVAEALARYPDKVDIVLPALNQALEAEADDEVRNVLTDCIRTLMNAETT